jgi:RES domain-containing protein
VKAYRFTKVQFADGLSGEGARRPGGRWNSKGVPVLYCATSESLAMLELRVHSPRPHPRDRWRFIIEVPDDTIHAVVIDQLPKEWNALPPNPVSKHFGDWWVKSQTSLGLLVPSVIATAESNLLLNPAHEQFKEVRVISRERVTLDRRLYVVVTPEKKL